VIRSLVALAVGGLALAGVVVALRWADARHLAASHCTYALRFPRDLDPARVVRFVAGVAGLMPPWWQRLIATPAVVLETRATDQGIAHFLIVPESLEPVVISHLRAALPGVRLTEVDGDQALRPTLAAELALSNSTRPLRVDQPQAIAAAILASLQPLRADEAAVLQWVLAPATLPARPHQAPIDVGVSSLLGIASTPRLPDARAVRDAEAKQAEPLFVAVGRIGVVADHIARQRLLLRRMTGAFHLANTPGVHLRVRWLPSRLVTTRLARRVIPLVRWPATLNAAELAGLIGFPVGDVSVSGLSLGAARQLPPPADIPRTGSVLAYSTYPGADRPLAIEPNDRLRHLHLLGPTGAGKTTLLLNLIVQDMVAGYGVVVVDPKGDLIADCLDRVPSDRQGDVILLDPTDDERPVGLNPLAGGDGRSDLVVENLVGIFHRLYADFWGPRTDDILRAALLTLTNQPGMTLCEVPLLLTDDSARRRFVARIDEPIALEPFWGWYEGLSIGERTNAIGPVLNKLRAFTLRRRIRNVIGQAEPALDFDRLLASRQILLVSLAKGVLGEEAASLVGALVLARLWQAALGRAKLPVHQRTPVFCHIDEVQDYLSLPTSIGDMLVQARSFGLGLTLSHQHLAQLPPAIRDSVLVNARSRVVFQTTAKDARLLASEFSPLNVEDLQGLGPYEVALKVALAGRVSSPATGTTPPAPEPTGSAEQVRSMSRDCFGRDRAEVEAAIRRRQSGQRRPPGDVGRRRRQP
jgi:type IV secretion system coupling TraD/TrwB family protein